MKPWYQRLIDVHATKDGTLVDAATVEKIVRELESYATIEYLQTGNNDIMTQVFRSDRHERAWGMGFGATMLNVWGASNLSFLRLSEEITRY